MRLDLQTRERVVTLKRQGYTYREIRERLREEQIEVTVKSLYLLVAKYNQTGSVVDRYRATRLRILGNEHYRVIDDALTQNDELTTRQLYNVLIPEPSCVFKYR